MSDTIAQRYADLESAVRRQIARLESDRAISTERARLFYRLLEEHVDETFKAIRAAHPPVSLGGVTWTHPVRQIRTREAEPVLLPNRFEPSMTDGSTLADAVSLTDGPPRLDLLDHDKHTPCPDGCGATVKNCECPTCDDCGDVGDQCDCPTPAEMAAAIRICRIQMLGIDVKASGLLDIEQKLLDRYSK